MIRRALQRVIERDLETAVVRGAHESLEVLYGAEGRLDRGVAAVLVADRPWTADVVRMRR